MAESRPGDTPGRPGDRGGGRAGNRARRGLIGIGLGLGAWLIGSLMVAHQLTRRPRRPFAEPVPVVSWGSFEAHRLGTRDGEELGAWFLRGREEAPSVLLLHGNAGSRGKCLDRAKILASQGCAVLLVSLRAHGDSTGEFNDIGYSARHDVVAAVEFLERQRPGRPIIVHGTSMGGAAAVFASGELGHRVGGYLLESPYQDLKVAVRNRTENSLPPVLDWVAYEGLLAVSPLVLPDLSRTSMLAAIGAIPAEVPVLILAGGEDRAARPAEARALFERVKTHGELRLFRRAGHLTFPKTDAAGYRRVVLDFVRAVEGRGRSRGGGGR